MDAADGLAYRAPTGTGVDGLFREAAVAARQAYCPYSGVHVGAAVQLQGGQVFAGCNVENSSYPVGTCAERDAIAAAMLGRDVPDNALVTLVLVAYRKGGEEPIECSPCGACRQAIVEQNPHAVIHFLGRDLVLRSNTASELLPESFHL
jgi:cytidine deaminase